MNAKCERLSENKVKFTIEITAEEFDQALDKAFEVEVKKVKVDGFRPGKMPKNLFLQRFGIESLYQEALDEVFNQTYPKAVVESKVIPTAEPVIDLDYKNLKQGSGFTYTAEVDIWPDVHLGEYKGLEVTELSKEVTQNDIDEKIKKVLADKIENVVKEGAAEKGDTVVIDFEGFIDGVAFEGGKGENYPLELGSGSFIPGFEDQLIGKKQDDEVDVNVTFPENYQADLAGKAATFKVKIHEVKMQVVPELTDDLVKELEIEGIETVDAYTNHLKEELATEKAKASENDLNNQLITAICKASYAEFPDSLIQNGVNQEVNRVEQQAKQYNIPVELFLKYSGIASMDDFKKNVEEYVRKSYLRDLVIEKIIEKENLAATDEEIEAEYKKLAEERKGQDINQALKQVKKQYRKEDINYHLCSLKVLEILKANAVIKKA